MCCNFLEELLLTWHRLKPNWFSTYDGCLDADLNCLSQNILVTILYQFSLASNSFDDINNSYLCVNGADISKKSLFPNIPSSVYQNNQFFYTLTTFPNFTVSDSDYEKNREKNKRDCPWMVSIGVEEEHLWLRWRLWK